MERLQKVIARAGVASRRKAEQLITAGKVKVNGQKVTELGTKVSPEDRVEVEGVPLETEEPVYFLFYKPKGIISSVKDDRGRKTVVDFFPEVEQRIFPVGRLDYDTSGLLILTNDGDFANLLMHPRYRIDKVYIAKIKGTMSREQIHQFKHGIELEDGKTAPARVRILKQDKKKNASIVEVVIHEGKNRQIRRMFESIGLSVLKLKRERFGFLTLDGLNPGEYRRLKPHEVKQLRALSVT